jgi:hypothetical protein
MKQTYHGSCHSGAVQYEALIDLTVETSKCNCTVCTKSRFWKTIVPAHDFSLVKGEDSLTNYQFGPKTIHHLFCKSCCGKSFGRWTLPTSGVFYAVNVVSLDDATPVQWAEAPVVFQDGRNDNKGSPPTETRYL